LLEKDWPAVEPKEVLAPRRTKPSSQASQPHSRSQSFVPWGQTLEMWPGTAPESSWDWMPAMVYRSVGSDARMSLSLGCVRRGGSNADE
jgi:hypothetical protein